MNNNMSSSNEGIDESNPKLGVKLLSGFASSFFFGPLLCSVFILTFLVSSPVLVKLGPSNPQFGVLHGQPESIGKTEHCVFIVCVFISQQVKTFFKFQIHTKDF